MTPPARLSAAIEVLADIAARRRPAADALKDWGLAHRFAGSGDRAAIASLVYDALRRRASAAWIMADESPRSLVIGMLRLQYGRAAPTIAEMFSGERFAPAPLSDDERRRLAEGTLADAPLHVAGDVPEWVLPSLAATFGSETLDELRALSRRAPLDIRINTLKRSRAEALAGLAHLTPEPTPHAPNGLRIPIGEDGRGPALHVEPEFIDGWYEIQDEGSQLASLLCGARPGETVIDLCAGGGGKTLSLAAMMENSGRLVASDDDPRRLAPIHERLRRAGATAEIRTPRTGKARTDVLADLDGSADRVLVDAPCTGSGTWRRNPDAKWRMRPNALSTRSADQATVLDRAARLVRPGGRITYVTCSLLPEENDAAIAGFLGRRSEDLTAVSASQVLAAYAPDLGPAIRLTQHGLQMSPARTGTDGFYVATLQRRD
ncbi:MFS transporter [Methylobacterium sp. Leaf104]|uniref:RsmB/NOP family class I SAM-dependent RNA methyltransferase n=1 Tax=Methylobacterium TaxID=407 RepID=UPI0006F8E34A|nr:MULTISPECIES: RsmB/NOP family class I SAM-dependent RNA methyltransferase [Methylobacterium]KQP40657.1 MFS transporter [Methylobacterium sp. Leaf104]MCI9882746.1 RsmB/NOP family class I SAM-dependent RNA methyltransferase [Methylobacterium goesingense]